MTACRACGKEMLDTARFCKACGAPREGAAADTTSTKAHRDTPAEPSAQPKRRVPLPAILGAGAVAVVVLVVIGIVALGDGEDGDSNGSAEEQSASAETGVASAPEPGVGVPVAGTDWEVTIEDVSEKSDLSFASALGETGETEYTAKKGFTFIVVGLEIWNLDSTQKTKVSTKQVAITTEGGDTLTADGGGDFGPQSTGCLDCDFTTTTPQNKLSTSFVFVVKKEDLNREFKLQFADVPPIPFAVGADHVSDSRVSDQQSDQVAIGQTMDEVRAILGEPESSRSDLGGTRDCWYWNTTEQQYTVVCFDQDGLVMQFEE